MRQLPFFAALVHTPVQIAVQAGIPAATYNASSISNVVAYNASNASAFLQFFDSVAAPVVGTTPPIKVIEIDTLKTFTMEDGEKISVNTTLWVAATTTDQGSTSPSAAVDFDCNAFAP